MAFSDLFPESFRNRSWATEGAYSPFWLTNFLADDIDLSRGKILYSHSSENAAVLYVDFSAAGEDFRTFIPDSRRLIFAHGSPERICEILGKNVLALPSPTGGMVCRELREYLFGVRLDGLETAWATHADRYIASGMWPSSFSPFSNEPGEGEGVRGNTFPYQSHDILPEDPYRDAVASWLPPQWFHAWDFFYTLYPLTTLTNVQPDQPQVKRIFDLSLVRALLDKSNPNSEGKDKMEQRRWYGIEYDGTLATTVSAITLGEGSELEHVHLAGLGTDPDFRSRGLAARVMIEATNNELNQGASLVTFGMWGGNHPARRLYSRIGFINGGRQFLLGTHSDESPVFS